MADLSEKCVAVPLAHLKRQLLPCQIVWEAHDFLCMTLLQHRVFLPSLDHFGFAFTAAPLYDLVVVFGACSEEQCRP